MASLFASIEPLHGCFSVEDSENKPCNVRCHYKALAFVLKLNEMASSLFWISPSSMIFVQVGKLGMRRNRCTLPEEEIMVWYYDVDLFEATSEETEEGLIELIDEDPAVYLLLSWRGRCSRK